MTRYDPTTCRAVTGCFMALVLLGGSLISPAEAQDAPPVFSGPQPGEALPPLQVSLVYGEDAGMTVDLVDRADGRPALLVIVNGSNRPAARLTRTLMNFAEMRAEKLFAGVVYLAADRTAAEQQLKRAVSWWQVGPPVGISIDGAEGPGSYGLNRNVNLTVLVAHQGRVAHNHALVQPSETDAPGILREVVRLVGGSVPTEAELQLLSAPIHKLPNVPYRSAPADADLRRLICRALAAADAAAARTAAAAVDRYVAGQPNRQADLGHAAALLLEGRGRAALRPLPVAPHLRRWRQQHDPRAK